MPSRRFIEWLAARPHRRDRLQRPHVRHRSRARAAPTSWRQMVERSGLTSRGLPGGGRADAAPGQRGARLDRAAGRGSRSRPALPLLSHDDTSPGSSGAGFARSAAGLAEFPTTVETARGRGFARRRHRARRAERGARRKPHRLDRRGRDGRARVSARCWPRTTTIRRRCSPPSRWRRAGVVPLEQAWTLVSRTPAHAVRLDRSRGHRPRPARRPGHRRPIGTAIGRASLPRSYPVASCISAQAEIIATSGRRRLGVAAAAE